MTALDIGYTQVAIDFDDPTFPWHWRCLVSRLGDSSNWVGFTTDLDVEVVSLADHVVVVCPRNAAFPKKIRGKF